MVAGMLKFCDPTLSRIGLALPWLFFSFLLLFKYAFGRVLKCIDLKGTKKKTKAKISRGRSVVSAQLVTWPASWCRRRAGGLVAWLIRSLGLRDCGAWLC